MHLWRHLLFNFTSGNGSVLSFLVLLSFFSTPVLEPDFDLSFRKTEVLGEFSFSADGNIATVMKFLFQFKSLMITIYDSVFVFSSCFTWENKKI